MHESLAEVAEEVVIARLRLRCDEPTARIGKLSLHTQPGERDQDALDIRCRKCLNAEATVALFFSIVSPDDDAFQQELIRPATPSLKVSAYTRVAARRSLAELSIGAFADRKRSQNNLLILGSPREAAGDPVLALKTGRLVIMDQPLDVLTHFQAPISIHSPPTAS